MAENSSESSLTRYRVILSEAGDLWADVFADFWEREGVVLVFYLRIPEVQMIAEFPSWKMVVKADAAALMAN